MSATYLAAANATDGTAAADPIAIQRGIPAVTALSLPAPTPAAAGYRPS